jgi:H+-transporting ATPase
LPVEKHLSDVAYSGSIVKQGEMNAYVVATGIASFFGRTTKLVAEAKTGSHFQKAVIKIGNYLIVLAALMVSAIVVVALIRQFPPLLLLQFALVLVVAAIPVALPAVLTVTMAIGATALAKKEAIVSKLVAIEEMAGVDVLCSDKTGTITKNELTVATAETFGEFNIDDALLFGALASREENHDPIDDAVIAKAKTSSAVADALGTYNVLDFKPFDPVSKRTEATLKNAKGEKFNVSKGAPQVILALVQNKSELENRVNEIVNAFAAKGYRALGVAKTDAQGTWQYTGLLAIYDPPREDSAETIETAQKMGVNVKMVTGDHIAIAKQISQVNDAPALKKADAGIAVAGATDAAKSAADVVLTKLGLSVIIDTLRESRKIFRRMNNYAIYRIAETIRVLIFLTLSIIIFDFYPLTAVMIVILALLNDLPIMMIAYDNVKIHEYPVRWNMRDVLVVASLLGVTGVFSSFFLFLIGVEVLHLSMGVLQTLIFLKMTVGGHMTIYLARTGVQHFWERPLPAKILFFTAESTQFVGTLIAVYGVSLMTPLGWGLAGLVWGYALLAFLITDVLKIHFFRLMKHTDVGLDTKSKG